MKKKSPIETFLSLSDAEKEAEVARLVALGENAGRPLNAAERKQWARIKRKIRRGRPVVGKGATTVPLSIERDLLKKTDSFAKSRGIKRSRLVAIALESFMERAKAG